MTEPTPYHIPACHGEAEFMEKRSRFIGRIWHVEDEEQARAYIASVQKLHHDATHNVYAYIITPTLMRYSDDNEPQGTAGIPVLNVLQQEELQEVCCVVTRYYGGILLGAGGLVRAYAKAAKLALDEAGTLTMRLWHLLSFNCPYPLFDQVKALLMHHQGVVDLADFAADVALRVYLPTTGLSSFMEKLQTLSAGRVRPEIHSSTFMAH